MDFCSDCKYAEITENRDGLKIICKFHKNPKNAVAEMWVKDCTVFRKLNAGACSHFVYKDVKQDR